MVWCGQVRTYRSLCAMIRSSGLYDRDTFLHIKNAFPFMAPPLLIWSSFFLHTSSLNSCSTWR